MRPPPSRASRRPRPTHDLAAKINEGLHATLDPNWTGLGVWVSTSMTELFHTEDSREDVRSFLEKRPPQLVGR
jgi:enoyl-CoA hydratase